MADAWRYKTNGAIAYGDASKWHNPEHWEEVVILTPEEYDLATRFQYALGYRDARLDIENKD